MRVSNTKTSNMKHRLIGFIGKVLLSFVLLLILVVLNWDDLKSSRPKLFCVMRIVCGLILHSGIN